MPALTAAFGPSPFPPAAEWADMLDRGTLCSQRVSEPGPSFSWGPLRSTLPPPPLIVIHFQPRSTWRGFLLITFFVFLSVSQSRGSLRAGSCLSVNSGTRKGWRLESSHAWPGLGYEHLVSQECYNEARKAPGACQRALWTDTSWGWRTWVRRPPPATRP